MKHSDVLIVGGGLTGLILALALARGGIASRVLDAAPKAALKAPDFDGRGYALALSTVRMLTAPGLWDEVADQAQPILDVKVSDGRVGEGPSPLYLHFDHHEIEEGPMGQILEDRHLRKAVLEAAEAEPLIAVENGVSVTDQAVRPGGVSVTTREGPHDGVLLVGCDGRGSETARRAGIKRTEWSYQQTSLVCAIDHEHPHNGIAHQLFLPAGPLAILPLPGNRSSIVWTETTERAADINAKDDAGYLNALRPRFGGFLGDISLAGRRFSYPLGLSLAQSLTAPRVVLAGDAAHGIHPLAGQGLNLGLRDVAALAEVLVQAKRRGEDIGAPDVLDRYRRWRSFDIAAMAAATDGINRVFSNDNPLLRLGRDLALGAINKTPVLRRTMIRQAAGLSGDLPALMKGRLP
ncbi:FAD-dependent monooxygenase [Halovulum sp. GXIMD14793]